MASMTTSAQPTTSSARPRWRFRQRAVAPYLFMAPFAALFLVFFIAPIGYALWTSLFHLKRSGLGIAPPQEVFAGLTNFQTAVSDPTFLDGVKRVLLYGAVYVPVMLGLALALALLIDSARVRFRNVFLLAILIPYTIPNVISALLWGFLYSPTISPLIKGLQATPLHVNPLSSGQVLWGLVNIGVWEWTGYNLIIIYSALKAIPTELYEAARIDGATEFAIARYIKAPLVAPALVLTGIFAIIATLQLFNEPRVLSVFALSVSSTFTPNMYIYDTAFFSFNINYASGLAFLLAFCTFILSFTILRLGRRFSGV